MIRSWSPELLLKDMRKIIKKNVLSDSEEEKEMIANIVFGYIEQEWEKKGIIIRLRTK